MADVFISYARSTAECAEALARIIESDGHSVWYDARLPAHRAYADVIQEQLDAARAVVIIWSSEAVLSHWVRSEADRARTRGTLVQMRIDPCALPMPFDQIECPLVERWNGESSIPALSPVLASLSELLGGGTAAGLGSAAKGSAHPYPEEARVLFESAAKELQSGVSAAHAQAIPLLIEATRLVPGYSEAWGLLSVLFAARRLEVAPPDRLAMVARARSAIKTTLTLDPNDVRARCAEVILITPYRNWPRKEQGARQILSEAPDQPLALFSLATVLGHVGRWRESSEVACLISHRRFLLPAVEQFTIQALWSAGDLVQAELVGERAARRFPAHEGLWETRVALLMNSGRVRDAIAMIDGDQARPPNFPPGKLEALRSTALALAGSIDCEDAVRMNIDALGKADADPPSAAIEPLMTAQRCASLGRPEECLKLLDGYYFGTGPFADLAPPGGDEDRSTWALFMPPMAALWGSDRFERLMAEIGLEQYWTELGLHPDYRS